VAVPLALLALPPEMGGKAAVRASLAQSCSALELYRPQGDTIRQQQQPRQQQQQHQQQQHQQQEQHQVVEDEQEQVSGTPVSPSSF
jgi:hypothetical protein